MADLVYGGRFDLNPARNTRETLLLPIAGLKQLQQPGVYLAVMRASGTYNYSQPATLFTLSDIGLSVHRYANRLDVFTQALEGGKALDGVDLEVLDADGRVLGQGKTEKGGHAELPLPKRPRYCWPSRASRPVCCASTARRWTWRSSTLAANPHTRCNSLCLARVTCIALAKPCCSMRCCATRTATPSSRNR